MDITCMKKSKLSVSAVRTLKWAFALVCLHFFRGQVSANGNIEHSLSRAFSSNTVVHCGQFLSIQSITAVTCESRRLIVDVAFFLL